jgi:excisionase family DNA binding protein
MHTDIPLSYTVAEGAELINSSESFIRKKINLGELPVYRFGGSGQMRVLHRDLVNLLQRVEIDSTRRTGLT